VSAGGGLFSAELRRFFSRRVVRAAFALGIALATLVLVILTARSDIRTSSHTESQTVCPTVPLGTATTDPSNIPGSCVTQNFFSNTPKDHRLKVGANLSDTIRGTGIAMVLLAFVLGASFIGAEFAAGSIGTQLSFEPRRARVVVTKAIAVGIGALLLAIALLLYIALLQAAGSSLRGVVSGLDAAWFAARAGDVGRVAAATGLAAVVAFAITVVARRTVAAVAGLIIVLWVSAIIGQLDNWRWVAKYNPTSALIQMALNLKPEHHDRSALSLGPASLSSCLWAAGLTVVAATIFARREVR
jgi:ABC-type transport system involved in multi-copper enzyme maturation permease subunit